MINDTIVKAKAELAAAIGLAKCRQCGCLRETLDGLAAACRATPAPEARALADDVAPWQMQMDDVRYACLGCDYCYPAAAQDLLAEALPDLALAGSLACEFHVVPDSWPAVAGEYCVLDRAAPIAVSTLGSLDLASALAARQPAGLAIVGKTETENIGLDKIIKNTVANPSLRCLVVSGRDPVGHFPGQTLLALAANGVDVQGRVIGSNGKRPILRNVSVADVAAFRQQVRVVDMIGCEDVAAIAARVGELAAEAPPACDCGCGCDGAASSALATVPTVLADDPLEAVALDRAGYFVVLPLHERGRLSVEHYAYDNTLLRVIEGATARALYMAIIQNGWVTELSHAAYLGKELAKAELSLRHGLPYRQDGA